MIRRDFAALVEECLQRLDRGDDLPVLLADYPQHSDQLKPILLVAMASRAFPVPIPCQTAQRLGRTQMLAEMNGLEIKKAFRKQSSVPLTSRAAGFLAGVLRQGGYNKLAFSSRLAMVSLVLIFTGGFLTLNASAASQPGDFLYTLKTSLQRAGLVWLIDADQTPQFPGNEGGGTDFRVPVGSERSAWNLGGSNYLLDRLTEDYGPEVPSSFTAEESELDSKQVPPDLPDTAAAEYAPGTQDEPATVYAPGLQDGPATDYAPGQVKDTEPTEPADDGGEVLDDQDVKEEEKDLKEEEKEDEKDLKEDEKEADKLEKETTTKDKTIEKPTKNDKEKDKDKD